MKNKYNVTDLFASHGGNFIMPKNSTVSFKGNKDGISIYLSPHIDYSDIKVQLVKKLESTKQFFEGAKVIGFEGKELSEDEKAEIKEIIQHGYSMIVVEEAKNIVHEPEKKTNLVFTGIEEGMTKFVRTTVRSGQKIIFNGNVVVLGDVNPGGEIIAAGNIIVMGALRGLAHAGSNGNNRAYVAAISLQPTQLRIADTITRSPDNEVVRPMMPELALIKDNMLVIEPYLPNR
ncbi:MAG: septum site-determining protein MinC [Anaerosolibacter sp.]|jgi:septum site-determining protein MinC|uniref:septum site-determining protein MinC n=1 Tax=Anaerosolibacter sp. TaxID=1872527 RepID=UPI002605B184|nr:septum site-determining protein MinC [Anaerosolibacter sp.]MDF2547044.1 septum site-determining protein MinC [Anaerosolibacter sp.]